MTATLLARPGRRPTPDQERWFAVAEEVAGRLAEDALERDRAGRPPFAEVALLREAGLLPLNLPAEHGGGGQSLSTALEVTQLIGRADSSIGLLLGYHYVFATFAHLDLDPARSAALHRETVRDGLLWASTGTPQGEQLRATGLPGGAYRVSGAKPFSTGSRVADRLYATAVDEAGDRISFVLDTGWPGVVRHDDWDALGSRLTATDTIELVDVLVPASAVVVNRGRGDETRDPHRVLTTPSFQLLFSHAYLASAEGALLQAREYTRASSRPWFHAAPGVEEAVGDPFVQNLYGELVARQHAVAASVQTATDALEWALGRGEALTATERAQVAELVAAAKVVSTQFAVETTSRVFEAVGARATASRHGFDRYWRDVRTHSLHDPVAYKLNELGRWFLCGEAPVPSAYR